MSMRGKLRLLAAAGLIGLALAISVACSSSSDTGSNSPSTSGSSGVDEVTFMAGFKPQANLPFVGVYVAQEKGYFADEHLKVNIQHVATPGDNFRFLATGDVQFSTADASELLDKRAGDPPLDIVSVALIGQRGQQGFAVLADSGIASPKDWAGKTAGYKGSDVTPDYLAILNANGVDRSSVKEVKVGFEPQILTEHKVDVFPVFVSNEPDTLARLGFQTKVFEAASFGAPTVGLTYVTTGDEIRNKPDVVQRFLRATFKAIHYSYLDKNRQEAVDDVMKYAPQEDPAHQRFMLDTEMKTAFSGAALTEGLGTQTRDQWQKLHDYLVQYGALPHPLTDVT